MEVLVQKFGGTSVASYEKMKEVCKIIEAHKEKYKNIAVVVSAMGRKGAPYATDTLISMCTNINDRPTKRELDMIMSCGEIISGTILATMLDSMGIPATFLTGTQAGIITTKAFSNAKIKKINPKKIQRELADGKVVIIAGFQGGTEDGEITTLGRGGSDTSAVAIGKALGSDLVQIYTDVDGIYFTDPRKYSQAKKLKEIEYEEMLELASLGAQVMHSRSVELAQKYNIELYVGLSCSDIEGTYIRGSKDMKLEDKVITGLATCDNDAAITIVDIKIEDVSKLFEQVAINGVSVDMISQTAPKDGKVNVSFTIAKDDLNECESVVEKFVSKENIIVDEDITKFSLVGLGMKHTSGVAAKVFKIFSDNNIAVKLITTSEIRITCAISSDDKNVAIREVAKEFNI